MCVFALAKKSHAPIFRRRHIISSFRNLVRMILYHDFSEVMIQLCMCVFASAKKSHAPIFRRRHIISSFRNLVRILYHMKKCTLEQF
jgi:hypothetical protein